MDVKSQHWQRVKWLPDWLAEYLPNYYRAKDIEGKMVQLPPALMEHPGALKYLESITIAMTDNDGPSDYRWIVDLPALTNIRITDPHLTEAQAQMIIQRPGIQTLEFVSNKISGEFFTLLPAKKLGLIGLESRSFDRKYLNYVAKIAPLRDLLLRDIHLMPDDVAAISSIKTMSHLYIDYTTPHGPMDLTHLSKSTIIWLDINNLSLTRGDLKSISAIKYLNTLWLSGCQVEHGAFAEMTRPINRMVVSLSGQTASDAYIDQLSHIRTKFELQAGKASLSTSGYRQLADNQYLAAFNGGELTINQLELLLENQSLGSLRVKTQGTITPSIVDKIKRHKSLWGINFDNLDIPPEINAEIKKARPNIRFNH